MKRVINFLERNVLVVLQVLILWLIIGSATFLIYAWFRTDKVTVWDDLYFIWDSGKDVLLLTALFLTIDKRWRWLIWPSLIYFTIVFIWQIVAPITRWDVNHPTAVVVVFSALLTIVIILLRKDLINKLNGL